MIFVCLQLLAPRRGVTSGRKEPRMLSLLVRWENWSTSYRCVVRALHCLRTMGQHRERKSEATLALRPEMYHADSWGKMIDGRSLTADGQVEGRISSQSSEWGIRTEVSRNPLSNTDSRHSQHGGADKPSSSSLAVTKKQWENDFGKGLLQQSGYDAISFFLVMYLNYITISLKPLTEMLHFYDSSFLPFPSPEMEVRLSATITNRFTLYSII